MLNFNEPLISILKNKVIIFMGKILWITLLASGFAISICMFIYSPCAYYLLGLIFFSFWTILFLRDEFNQNDE